MTSMSEALQALATLIEGIGVTNGPAQRVWVHPDDYSSISDQTYPFVVISKMNTEAGTWQQDSWGSGLHYWEALIAVYLAPGPLVVTSGDKDTADAMTAANEWYEKLAGLLQANMTLGGTVEMIGSRDTNVLYEYITDNILWDGKQHYGHLFMVPITQLVIQETSS